MMSFLGKIFKKKDSFDLDSDPFKDLDSELHSDLHSDPLSTQTDSLASDGMNHLGTNPNPQSTTEHFEHGTLTTSKEFSPVSSTPMQAPDNNIVSNENNHVQELLQRDMQIINAKLDAIKANVEILSHKIESLEKSTTEKKKNTYW